MENFEETSYVQTSIGLVEFKNSWIDKELKL